MFVRAVISLACYDVLDMESRPAASKFSPGASSKIHLSPHAAGEGGLLELFDLGCRAVIQGQLSPRDIAERMLAEDPELPLLDIMHEIEDAVKKFTNAAVIPDVKIEDVERILTDDKFKVENLGAARRGITYIFFGMIKKFLMEPEQLAKIKPDTIAKWFDMMRYEEDSERKLLLMAQQNAIEFAKTKILFFRAIDGTLAPGDVDLLEADLRKDLLELSDGGKLLGTAAGVPQADAR